MVRFGGSHHGQRDVPVPADRAADLVVARARFLLGRLEGVLDAPAAASHARQGLQVTALRSDGPRRAAVARVRQESRKSR